MFAYVEAYNDFFPPIGETLVEFSTKKQKAEKKGDALPSM